MTNLRTRSARSWGATAPAAGARRAFTLLELLVVIGIIALLAALVVGVSTSVIRNSERRQVESMFQALDQAIAEYERDRGRPISFRRAKGDREGPEYVYDIVELTGDDYLMVCLLNGMDIDGDGPQPFRPGLLGHPAATEILKRIDPDFLRRDTTLGDPKGPIPSLEYVPSSDARPRMELVDPWGNRIGVALPGRRKLPRETGDPDGTVRTSNEDRFGVCRDRRILFVSAGPDGKFDTREDNIFSYEPIRPPPEEPEEPEEQ